MVDISMGKYSQLDLIEDSSITIYERNAEGSSLDGSSSARFKKLASSDAGAGLEELGSDNPLHDCNDRIDMPGDSSHPNGVSVEPSSRREPEMTVKQRLVGWACLFLAIMSGSLIGPMFRYIQNAGIAPVLAASWRCQCMSIFLSILAVLERSCNRANRVAWTAPNPDLNGTILFYVFVAGMGWAGNLLLWVSALRYTTVVRAGLAASMHPVFLIAYLGIKGQPLSSFEWVGTTITVTGLFVAAAKDIWGGGEASVIGDLLGLVSAVCQVVVILNRHKIKKYVPLWQYSASTTLMVAVASAIVHLIVDGKGPEYIFCTREDCVFGWMAPQWLQTMLMFSFVVSVCIAGYNYSVQFVSPLVFSTVVLVDPAVSGFIAWLTGLEGAPPPLSWIGGFFIIGGIFYVTIGEYMRKMQDEGSPVPPWIQTLDLSYWLGRCMKFSRGYETMSQMPSSRDDDSRRGLGELEAMEVDVEMSQSVHSLRRHSISLSLSDPMGDKAVISTEQPINDMDAAIASISAPVPEILLEGQPSAPDGGTLMGVAVRRRLSDAVPPTVDELAY